MGRTSCHRSWEPWGHDYVQAFYGGFGGTAYSGYVDQAPISNQFVNGVLTVPLAQVVTNGNITLNFDPVVFAAGDSHPNNFIGVQQLIYNFLGGDAAVDPHAVLDYSTNTIHSMLPPVAALEPSAASKSIPQ